MVTSRINKGNGARHPSNIGAFAIIIPSMLFLLPVAMLGPNTLLAIYACLALIIGIALLWRPAEPPILLFLFLYQWVQATIATFYSNILGEPLGNITERSGHHEEAVALIITGLIVLAFAIRIAAGRDRPELSRLFQKMVNAYPHGTWVRVYVVAWIFSAACKAIAPYSGGLIQVFLIFADLKWAAFLLLTASTFSTHRQLKSPWIIAFVIEFALGISGFFAGFSSIFFYSLIGISFAGRDVLARNKVLTAVIAVTMIFFAVAWTSVKGDYRNFVNSGTNEQVVLVGYQDRMTDLFNRISALDGAEMTVGVHQLVKRITYFEFFGIVLKQSAMGQPHSGGEIWGWGAAAPFLPRLLFPDKPIVDDTLLTIRFTGLNPEAWRQGTSISLGYMTEAFIDFGFYGMFFAIAALGLLIGSIHKWLLRQTGWRLLLGAGFVPVALMQARLLEISIVKLLPALFLSILAGWVLFRFFAPMLFQWVGVIKR